LSQPTAMSRSEVWRAVLAEQERAQRVARARCSSPQDAEDCVQEAMARVVAMPDVDLRRVGPLLSVIVANLAADTHRVRSRAVRAEPRLRASALAQPSPEDDICDALEAQWLWERRVELPEQDRAVLEFRAQGRSAAQAAEALGVTYKAAESAYTRARTRMRAIWRAAGALLGVLWARPARETAPVAIPVAASVLAVLAVLGVVPPGGAGQATPGKRGVSKQPVSVQSSVPTATGTDAAVPTRAAPTDAGPTPLPRPTSAAPAPPTRLIPRSSAGPVYAPGVRGGEERTEESFTDTVDRCLREGLIVTPTHVDCAG
jgi:RNA polymerase sigma factor (sigma-70 family)